MVCYGDSFTFTLPNYSLHTNLSPHFFHSCTTLACSWLQFIVGDTFLLCSFFQLLSISAVLKIHQICSNCCAVSVHEMFHYAACPGNVIPHVRICFVHGNCHSLQMNRDHNIWWRVLKLILLEFARIFSLTGSFVWVLLNGVHVQLYDNVTNIGTV
jgi:hypothetical protein